MTTMNCLVLAALTSISVSSCSSLQKPSAAEVDSATIRVSFRSDAKLQERWSIVDVNTDAVVFDKELFQPGEVKRASITTGPSRRFGEVRYQDSRAIVWTQDSLIENDGIVELRTTQRIEGAESGDQ